MNDAFYAYKLNSSINRTFEKCNFKEKKQTIAETKILKLIEDERIAIKKRQARKYTKLSAGEKNFWRRAKARKRHQSISIAQNDQDDDTLDQGHFDNSQLFTEGHGGQTTHSAERDNLYKDFVVTPTD